MKWRKWNNIIHRDLGYLCVGLTIIYAISGIAVNHIQDWNPNFHIQRENKNIGQVPTDLHFSNEVIPYILNRVNEISDYQSYFRPDSQTIQIFANNNTIITNLVTGEVMQEKVKTRMILREMNFLHLNHPKKLWTWFADVYAISLTLLAITGMFVIKGKKGINGRGKWLILIGIILPIIFLVFYF